MCCGQKRTAAAEQSGAGDDTEPSPNTSPAIAGLKPSGPNLRRHRQCEQFRKIRPSTRKLEVYSLSPPAPISTPQSSVSVRYLENSPIRVRGLVSGMSLRVLRFATRSSGRCSRCLISIEHAFLPSRLRVKILESFAQFTSVYRRRP